MTMKNRFMMSAIWVVVIPVFSIILIGVVMLTWFFVSDPAHTAYIFNRADALTDPVFVKLLLIWAALSVLIAIICSAAVVFHLSATLLSPLKGLRKAADNIRSGNFEFEIMTSRYEELNELCTAFESMRKRLSEMDLIQKEYEKERSLLIANISHDLRTPITSIKGYTQGIMEGVADTPEKVKRYLSTIYQKAEILEDLAGSMSDFSKYEMKRIHYDFKAQDIVKFVSGFAEECRLDLEGVDLKCTVPDQSIIVLLDIPKMRRVLSNIVGNAVKYKKEDSEICQIQISLEYMQEGVCISIADNGIGISEEYIKKVFESHFRVDPSRTNQVTGQGLGLSIAKQIVEGHKGKIWITSKANVGTTIYIYLPLHKDELEAK